MNDELSPLSPGDGYSTLDAALQVIEEEIPKLKTEFRVPAVEALAVLWPCADSEVRGDKAGRGMDAMNDFLD